MEITNKTLTWLVVMAIAVSLFATGITLTKLNSIKGVTGFAAGDTSNVTGNVSVSLSTQTILRFHTGTLDLGTLSVNPSSGFCNLSLNGTGNVAINYTNCDSPTVANAVGLMLENAGSTWLNITINFSKNAATLIGGAGTVYPPPYFRYTIWQNETPGCATMNATVWSTWTNVTSPATPTLICNNLSYVDGSDSLGIGIELGIPLDASSGSRNVTIYAVGTALN
jgi:hypothetical protein